MKTLDLFIFVDALGWKLVKQKKFLQTILPYQYPCKTIFGYSCTCDPTILTGELPEQHGHFSFFVEAKNHFPFKSLKWLSWLPHKIAGHHRIRNKVSQFVAKRLGYTGYFQLYSVPFSCLPYLDYTEKKDIYEPHGILGGQKSIFEIWKNSGKPWIRSDWRKGDDINFKEIHQKISEGNIELAYLFTANLDALMHRYGTSNPEVDQGFELFSNRIEELYKIANDRYDKVNFYVFSDHGMADTKKSSDLLKRFNKLGLSYGKDYIAAWDSTMLRLWFPGGTTVRNKVHKWLIAQSDGSIISDDQLKKWGCFFPDKQYGEIFYLLPPGTIFVPSFMNQNWVNGMHGYSPDDEDSIASWLTNNPDAKPEGLQNIFNVMKNAASR